MTEKKRTRVTRGNVNYSPSILHGILDKLITTMGQEFVDVKINENVYFWLSINDFAKEIAMSFYSLSPSQLLYERLFPCTFVVLVDGDQKRTVKTLGYLEDNKPNIYVQIPLTSLGKKCPYPLNSLVFKHLGSTAVNPVCLSEYTNGYVGEGSPGDLFCKIESIADTAVVDAIKGFYEEMDSYTLKDKKSVPYFDSAARFFNTTHRNIGSGGSLIPLFSVDEKSAELSSYPPKAVQLSIVDEEITEYSEALTKAVTGLFSAIAHSVKR